MALSLYCEGEPTALDSCLLSTMSSSLERPAAAINHLQSLTMATGIAKDATLLPSTRSWAGLFGTLLIFILRLIRGMLYWLITFTTLRLPSWAFTVFSTSLTITLNATTLILILVAMVSTVSWFVRYRYLMMYSRLPPEPQRKEPQVDLFPDTQEEEGTKYGLSNYLDEFLSAIKVFGYLERPVFHELTRSMQTRKLIAGETLNLEEEKGFCLVVDGLVEIFVKSARDGRRSSSDFQGHENGINELSYSDEEDRHEDGYQGYHLLTEVKNGAPMSSLFSILSLFTEDVKLRYAEDGDTEPSTPGPGYIRRRFPSDLGQGPIIPPFLPTGPIDGASENSKRHLHQTDRSPPVLGSPMGGNALPRIPPMSLDPQESYLPKPPNLRRANTNSVHPDIVARATVDTTIATIPASAFRRLTRVYPKATAHIVQVILARLQRVTLATGHSYLGLTSEVMRTEKHMNKYTTYELPNFLRGDALERLKSKFNRERERIGPEEGRKGIALHNSDAHRRRTSSVSLRKEAVMHALSSKVSPMPSEISRVYGRDVNASPSPGDLLTNIQISRDTTRRPHSTLVSSPSLGQAWQRPEIWPLENPSPLSQKTLSPFTIQTAHPLLHRQESIEEDSIFRASILECIFKAIGLTNTRNALRMSESVEASPRLVSYDQRRQKAIFSNAFGLIDPYDGSADGDTDSMTSGGMGVSGSPSLQSLVAELKNEVEIVYFPRNSVLVEQGERNPGLYYVIDGFLDVSVPTEVRPNPSVLAQSQRSSVTAKNIADRLMPQARTVTGSSWGSGSGIDSADSEGRNSNRLGCKSLSLIKPGGIAGYIGTISSHRSFIDVIAQTDVYVGFLPRSSLERIVEKHPVVLLTMAKRLTSLLPRLILHIDFALEWVQVDAGQVIYHQGDESDAIYITLNGRLRAVLNNEQAGMKVVGEYGQGESVGELEVMTESVRPATLHAIRDTELAKLPKTLFNSLAQEHPDITIKISKIIASRMRALVDNPVFLQGKEKATAAVNTNVSSTINLRTVAIIPVTAGVPIVEFGSRLMNALTQIGAANGVTSLSQAAILNHLGRHAFSRMGKLKLSQYLADLEEKYGLVLYIADTSVNSPWTQTCISQADCILLVGLAEDSPAIGEYERFMLGMKTTARKELVLLHADRYCPPGLTRAWLRNRVWINGGHHHIQMEFKTDSVPVHHQTRRFGSALKQRVQVLQAEIQKYTSRKVVQTPLYSTETTLKGDFHRIARRLCGKSIGLVLGGGGARGIAQVGIIRAIEEAGIPIDIVGGTSIGSFIGALYARDAEVVPMYGRAKKFAGRMASMWRFALDLTYPTSSYTTGHEFNRGIFKTFGDSQIEDFWLEFYCNTTNISKSRSEIHTSGYAWRYVRASMSLAGLIPPLCDEGYLLLDGGYIDNLTVSHMKSLGADVIIAIDVGALDDETPQSFGDSLSGFWAAANRWNPFSSHPNPPTLSEIQARLAYVSSVDALERAKTTPGCLYMRPPIDGYATLDFGKFDEIYELGYKYGREFLAEMRAKGALPLMDEAEEKKALMRTMAPRRASI